jgi:hypothetical protein
MKMFLEIDGERGHGESRMLAWLDTLRTRTLPPQGGLDGDSNCP